ncbi:MAG: TonB-dependent receptor [Bacteroidales bacterium]|nr:TonB-dependent receptor [Bacteroidales bacterium]
MKIIVFLSIVGLFLNSDFIYSQKTEINLNIRNLKIELCFEEIKKQSEYTFLYRSDLFENAPKVDIRKNGSTLEEILDELIVPLGFAYEIDDRTVIIKKVILKTPAKNKEDIQKKVIVGKVTDTNGDFIPGVNVLVKGTNKGTITNYYGNYMLEIPENESVDTLRFSFVGYKTFELFVDNKTIVNVILETDSKNVDQVIIIGYGAQRKSFTTGSSSALDIDDFNEGMIISPTEMIQGRAAGVQISMNSGEPGAGSTVRIRGASTVRANQDPLFVIDGVALDITDATPSGASAAGINSSSSKNPLNFLNPDDIASINVLKDASASAIYGARGANGVILITTKNGEKGADKLSYSAYGVISQLPKKLDLLNAQEYRNWYAENDLMNRLDDKGANTDWQDEIFQKAYTQSHSLSFSTNNNNSSLYASIGYIDQEGIIKRTGINKITGLLKLKQSFFKNRIEVDENLSVARTIDKRVPISETAGFEGDVLLSALKSNPTYPIFNQDGTYFQASTSNRNAVAMINLTDDKAQTDRILAKLGLNLEIFKGLSYKVNLSIDHSNATRKVTQDAELSYMTNNGTADIANVELTSKLIENYITYNSSLGNNHNLNVLLGHSFQTFQNLGYNLQVNNFTIQNVNYLSNLGYGDFNQANVGSSRVENELQSFFCRINYGLFRKYFVTATIRADGSTRFGVNNKYGYFPSIGAAWHLGKEDFTKELLVISNLKLRFSWGLTGNQEIPNKISQLALGTTPDGNYYFDGTTLMAGTTFIRTPNPNIKWETTSQTNIGLDYSFFDGRLSGNIEWFYKSTKDVLLQTISIAPAPTITMWENIPEMRILNKGIELELSGVIIDHKYFKWAAGISFSRIKNTVVDLPVEVIQTGVASGAGLSQTRVQVIRSGYPIGTFWGKKFLGYDEDGNSTYKKDKNGTEIDEDLGTALPDFTYGWNNSFHYRGFDLSFFINGVQGNKVYNNTFNASLHVPGLSHGNNVTKSIMNSKEGINNTPVYSSKYIEDGSFLRLSYVTIGYSIPNISKDWLKSIRVYLTGANLFLLTGYSGYDPEASTNANYQGVPSLGVDFTSYPRSRTFQFGVNVEF